MKITLFQDCIALKICRWHNFEMAEIHITPCPATAGNIVIKKIFVAGKAM